MAEQQGAVDALIRAEQANQARAEGWKRSRIESLRVATFEAEERAKTHKYHRTTSS